MKKQKPMNFQDKLDLIQSTSRVADFWKVEPAELIVLVVITKKESEGRKKLKEWNEIAEEVKAFSKASPEEKAKMLGIKPTKK